MAAAGFNPAAFSFVEDTFGFLGIGVYTAPPVHAQPAPTCVPPPPNMISWWPGDGNPTDIVGTNTGTLVNGAAFAPGMVGQAFSLLGSNDYVDVGGGFNLTNMTLDAWVLIDPATNTGNIRVISKDNYQLPGTRKTFILKSSGAGSGGVDGGALFQVLIGEEWDVVGAPSALTAGWHHLAGVRDVPANRFELYVDGAMVASKTPTVLGPIDSDVQTVIGTMNPSLLGENFSGLIDEVEIFNRGLTQTEIQAIVNAGSAGKCKSVCTPPPPNMVAWWRGEDNTNDAIGSNNGTLFNGTTFGGAMVRRGFVLDGTDDYVRFPASASLDVGLNDGFSVDAWIRSANPDVNNPMKPILEWSGEPGDPNGFGSHFYLSAGVGALFANLIDTNGVFHVIESGPGVITAGTFSHVALTYNKTTGIARMYRNGEVVASETLGSFTPKTSNNLYLGARVTDVYNDPGYRFTGVLDEIEVFGREISQSEIQAIFNAGSAGKCAATCTPPPPEMIGWWPGDGNATDIIGGNNGTPIGNATYAAGMVQQAFSLDGYNDFVDLTVPNINTTAGADVTVDFWN